MFSCIFSSVPWSVTENVRGKEQAGSKGKSSVQISVYSDSASCSAVQLSALHWDPSKVSAFLPVNSPSRAILQFLSHSAESYSDAGTQPSLQGSRPARRKNLMFLKNKILWLFLLFLFLYILPLGFRPMISPDETRYAEIAREMIESGNYISPTLNGVRYFEKPVLGYWAFA